MIDLVESMVKINAIKRFPLAKGENISKTDIDIDWLWNLVLDFVIKNSILSLILIKENP